METRELSDLVRNLCPGRLVDPVKGKRFHLTQYGIDRLLNGHKGTCYGNVEGLRHALE